jgi:hypothetical protein
VPKDAVGEVEVRRVTTHHPARPLRSRCRRSSRLRSR